MRNQLLFFLPDISGFPNYDGNHDLTETTTSQESVCLLQTENSQRYYVGRYRPRNFPQIPDQRQIAQRCQLNFRTTMIGNFPIADLLCQDLQGQVESVAQYQQVSCQHEPLNR